jgi:Peptidase family S41
MTGITAAITALLLIAAQPTAQPAPVERDWGAAARTDVAAAYDLYAASHPGMHDPANPGFPALLGRARERGLDAARHATDRAGYAAALGAFSTELSDGHALVFAKAPEGQAMPQQWAGFIPAWRGGRLIVQQAAPGAPVAIGEVIRACDGLPAADFIRRRLVGLNFRPAEAGQWWFHAPRAFQVSQFLPSMPRACTIAGADGRAREVALTWTPAPEDFRMRLRVASEGERPAIALTEPRPGLFQIGLPDFQPDEAGRAAYTRLYEQMRTRRGELLRARAIVLDLRHNNGGSSDWSRDVARILWGQAQVDRAMADYFRGVAVWWRASPGNIAHMDQIVAQIRASGRESVAQEFLAAREAMRAAAARGDPYYREPGEVEPAGPAPGPSDLTIPVYVITPGGCASACLDAIDTFTRFPNVRLIGAPTSADSTYMEVRTQDLPSGAGTIVIPNKLWANRPRRAGEVYRPQIEFDDLGWTTAAFLDRIEADLRSR